MPRSLTAADRSALIRLASTLPAGSEERKAILKGLVKTAGHEWEYDRDADFWYLYDNRGNQIGGVGNDNGRYLPYGDPDEDWPIGRGSRDLEDAKYEVEEYLGLV